MTDYGTPDRSTGVNRNQPNAKLRQDAVPRDPRLPSPPVRPTYSAGSTAPPASVLTPSAPPSRRRRPLHWLHFPRSWQFWGITLVVVFIGLGTLSATALLRLPSLPNCPGIFWPTASASLRMYCAQTSAERRTVRDLLRAISLVDALPADHPLRPEINRNIELWSKEILELGEEAFQAGDLNKAISIARKIPADTPAASLVDARIESWETTWKQAEDIYRQAEDALKQQNLRQAFRVATQLLGIDNQFWAGTKYRELNDLITATREDTNKIDKAKGLADRGGLNNLIAAVQLVKEIQPRSYVYPKAQQMLFDLGQDMMNLAEAALDRRDYNEALRIASQIPEEAKLQEEIRDFNLIAEAQSQAWGGTIADLEAAIVAVQRIKQGRPLYGKAQQLVSSWQVEIQDVTVLDRARQIAQAGTAGDLSAAIAEAQRIPFGNPRREEAEQVIGDWRGQIETAEDQPYLDRAEQLANQGNLQAAINEASRIGSGRSLYSIASSRIDTWMMQMQRTQDQPQLDRARQLASLGDLAGAISVARQIGSGRALSSDAQTEIDRWSSQLEQTQDRPLLEQARQLARQGNLGEAISVAEQISASRSLYNEAQAEIQQWRSQYQGQDQLGQAYNAARMGTPAMLAAAIEIASQVPQSNPAYGEANQMIDQWSYQILQMAEAQASLNPTQAIAIAEQVPANTAAYASAQRRIQTWRTQGQ